MDEEASCGWRRGKPGKGEMLSQSRFLACLVGVEAEIGGGVFVVSEIAAFLFEGAWWSSLPRRGLSGRGEHRGGEPFQKRLRLSLELGWNGAAAQLCTARRTRGWATFSPRRKR